MDYDGVCDLGDAYTKSCWVILILVCFSLLQLVVFKILVGVGISVLVFGAVMPCSPLVAINI